MSKVQSQYCLRSFEGFALSSPQRRNYQNGTGNGNDTREKSNGGQKVRNKVTFENIIILRFISNLWLILVLRSHTIFNQIENDVKTKLIVTPYR